MYLKKKGKHNSKTKEKNWSHASISRVLRNYSNNRYCQRKHIKSYGKPVTVSSDERKLKWNVKDHSFQNASYLEKNGRKWV